MDRPPRVEYVEVLPAGLAQLLGESTHQLDSLGCAPTPTRCARGLQFAAQADPDVDVAAPRGHSLADVVEAFGQAG